MIIIRISKWTQFPFRTPFYGLWVLSFRQLANVLPNVCLKNQINEDEVTTTTSYITAHSTFVFPEREGEIYRHNENIVSHMIFLFLLLCIHMTIHPSWCWWCGWNYHLYKFLQNININKGKMWIPNWKFTLIYGGRHFYYFPQNNIRNRQHGALLDSF